ncbi:MAG: GNAT family N-acetyltransferase [Mycoplasma sp.]|nr:GNAT family N-acetyltransferase [Mycoplasma sp.]
MSKHLKFRRLKKSDWKGVFQYGSNPEVTKYLNWEPFQNESEAKQAVSLLKARKGHIFSILVYGEFAGVGSLFIQNDEKKLIQPEVILDQKFWGMGVGNEALMQILRLSTAWYKGYTLYSKIHSNNEAGNALFKKGGFKKVKKQKEFILYEMKIL